MDNKNKFFSNIKRAQSGDTTSNNIVGIVSAVSPDGNVVHAKTFAGGEIRELKLVLPYGISSSAFNGMRVQINRNENTDDTVTGIIDNNRPKVKPGEIMLYSKSGTSIYLNKDGNISILGKNNATILVSEDGSMYFGSGSNGITINEDGLHIVGTVTINGVTV